MREHPGFVMPNVYFLPDQLLAEASVGDTLLHVALRNRLPIAHACGGHALCSTCRLVVIEGTAQLAPRTQRESRIAERLGFPPEFRLACQTRVAGDVTVRRLVLDEEDIRLADARNVVTHGAPGPRRRLFGGGLRRRIAPRPIGIERHVAVLFADIRGFTPFAEALLPYDVIHVLERHLTEMTEIVERNGGIITCYAGDGVMALFGLDHPERASLDAARAAMGMIESVSRRRPALEQLHSRSFDVNVGIHAGDAIVGTMCGGVTPLTAVGDVVNIASRVEAANKEAGTRVLVTEPVRAELGEHVTTGRHVRRELPGKAGAWDLHEVLAVT